MHRQLSLLLAALAPFGLAACPTRDISKVDPSPGIEIQQFIDVSQNRNVDILFVIDNSHSMEEEQESLARNFPTFINVLSATQGGLPNIHLAVVSSDLGIGGHTSELCDGRGDDGLFEVMPRVPGCNPPEDPFIRDVALVGNMRDRNYQGSLADTFTCIARLGKDGCGVEQHLEAMKLALDGSRPINSGFLRQDAYLAVIIVADEDDCSANRANIVFDPDPEKSHLTSELGPFNSYRCTEFGIRCNGQNLSRGAADYENCVPRGDSFMNDPVSYFNFLKGLKANPNLLIGAVIAGNPTPVGVTLTDRGFPNLKPSCQSANGVADPGVRLKAFVDPFGMNGTFVSICQDDLGAAVERVADLLGIVLGTTCLHGNLDLRDTNPNMPGAQLNCQISDVRFRDQEGEIERPIPRCPMLGDETPDATGTAADRPCWWVRSNPGKCSSGEFPTRLELQVERGGDEAPIGTEVVARCAAAE